MNCDEAFEKLSARRDGVSGTAAERKWLAHHLAGCASCSRDEASLAALDDLFAAARSRLAPARLRVRVLPIPAVPAPRIIGVRRLVAAAAGFLAFLGLAPLLTPARSDPRAAVLVELHRSLPRLGASLDPERQWFDRLVARTKMLSTGENPEESPR